MFDHIGSLKKSSAIGQCGRRNLFISNWRKIHLARRILRAYADIVRERSVLRQLIAVAKDIAEMAFNPEGRNSAELLDEAERKIFQIAEQECGRGPSKISRLC